MKGRSGTKKRKNNDNVNNNITPQKHDKIGNLNYYSEEIAKMIINKLISLAITKVYTKSIENKLLDYHLNGFFRSTNNLIELSHINHDVDDMNEKKNIEKNLTFCNESKGDKNVFLNKTFNGKKDYFKIDKNLNEIQYNILIQFKNFWGDIPEPKSYGIDRTCNNRNNMKNEKRVYKENIITNSSNNNSIDNSNKMNSNRSISIKKKFHSYISKFINNEIANVKKKPTFIEFPSQNIPEESFRRDDETKEIKELRKVFIEEMNKKKLEKENEKKKKIIRETEKKKEKNIKKQKKGKLKSMIAINSDLLKKEFHAALANQKDIKPGLPLSNLEKELLMMEKEAGKNIEYNSIKSKEKEIKKEIIKQMLLRDIKDIKELKKERERDADDLLSSRSKPSGSNFEIMTPSIGVKIQQNSMVKSGGTNYFEKYNRFSINDFNKALNNELNKKAYENYNSATGITNLSLIKESKETKDKNNKENKCTSLVNTEETNEILSRKTFSNRFNTLQIRKKHLLKTKSNSVISLSNNNSNSFNTNILRDILSSRENDYSNIQQKLNYNFFNINSNEVDILFDKSLFIKNSRVDKKLVSPIPTNKLNLKKIIYTNNNDNGSVDKRPFKIIDNFNKQILTGEQKETLFGNQNNKNKRGIILPKINLTKKTNLKTPFYRTKKSFFRSRKKRIDNDSFKYNSNLL